MKALKLVGIDLAKEVFQLHGVDEKGQLVFRKRLRRAELAVFTAQLPSCQIAMEACGGSQYWARRFREQGHEPRLIAPHQVKPFRRSVQKNDYHDAQAIAEAAQRPQMRFVPAKSLKAQDLQSLHRVRQQFVKTRTALINQCRGLALEYGVTMDRGRTNFEEQVAQVLERDSELTIVVRKLIQGVWEMIQDINQRIKALEAQLLAVVQVNPHYERLQGVPGVGPLTASLLLANVEDVDVFKNGRHMAAWLGLVPRQFCSGENIKLGGMTKAGNSELRTMLIHGARALIQSVRRKNRQDRFSQWILRLLETKGWNTAAVAVANRNCRVVWHLMKYEEEYKVAV